MIKKNIALVAPIKEAYSETFIQQHRINLDGNVTFYFNGFMPKENDVEGIMLNLIDSIFFKLKRLLRLTKLSVHELSLIKSFKKQKTQIVVAEFGPSGVAVQNVCKYLDLPLITIFHGYDASKKSILEKYKESYFELFNFSFKIIAVSKKIAETLIDLGCNKQKVIITPCAPDDIFFDLKPKFENPQFIGAGRFVDKKAPYYTIFAFQKAVQIYPEAKLVLAGEGHLFNSCKNIVNYLGLNKSIDLVGVISKETMSHYFENSLAFLQHSIIAENGDSEGTPVTILEASAAGLPIISTFHAGIPDVIIDLKTGFLVNEHDVDAMASKMIILLNDFSLAKQMGSVGRKNVKMNFSKSIHTGILNKIIKESFI